jgi:hypothetical protein
MRDCPFAAGDHGAAAAVGLRPASLAGSLSLSGLLPVHSTLGFLRLLAGLRGLLSGLLSWLLSARSVHSAWLLSLLSSGSSGSFLALLSVGACWVPIRLLPVLSGRSIVLSLAVLPFLVLLSVCLFLFVAAFVRPLSVFTAFGSLASLVVAVLLGIVSSLLGGVLAVGR